MAADPQSEAAPAQETSRTIHGSSQMAERIRNYGWSSTALGPIEGWSECLVCSINTMLCCGFPSLIFWGPEMVQLYNDPFIPLFAERHPSGLGQIARDCWSDAWELIGPRLERVLHHGETIYDEKALVPILRDGRVQDVWWTYSYSPILGSDGVVAGILVVCQDITRELAAEQHRKESESQAQRVLQSIGDAVIVTDAESRVVRMNPVAEQLTGWTAQQACGEPLAAVFKIMNELTRDVVENPAEKVKAGNRAVGVGNRTLLVSRTGREIPIDDSGAPIFDSDGKLSGVVLVFRDVEERRAMLREKEALAEQLSQLLAATSDAVVGVDRNWVMTYLNPRAVQLYGADRETVGRVVWEVFPEAIYKRSPFVEHYRRAMYDRIPGSFEAHYPEPLNMWLRVEVFPTRDGIVTFSRDITQERADREALREKSEEAERQRAELETLYRTAPIGLALFDTKDFRYLRLNDRQAEFFGLKPEQVVGRTLTEMAPIEGLKELFEQVLAGKPVVNFPLEGRLVTNPAEHRYWTVSYFPVLAADGSIRAITAASLEVTQQKRAEKALMQSEKLAVAGRLAASIAHEINNPLEAVTNLLFLARSSDNLQYIQEFITTAERELRRVAVISSQTLRFHKQSTSPQEITCDELFASVLSMYQGRLLNSAVEVEERRRAVRPVRCFEGEIRQVLSNLIGNAIDAMQPAGGRLLLRSRMGTNWRTGQQGVVMTVADSGTGIAAEVMHRLFEPFYTTKDIGGTGLGLWVSKEIIDRHGGTILVRSSRWATSHGTVFAVYLPFEAVNR